MTFVISHIIIKIQYMMYVEVYAAFFQIHFSILL